MDFHNLLSLKVFFHVVIHFVIFATLVESVLSADSRYEACMPQNCGTGPNISYPFWILNKSRDFCNEKGFDITCEQNKPFYKNSGGHYLIEDISYENQSFHLVDVEVLDPACFAPQQNFSFNQSSLTFQSSDTLLFFYNYSENFSSPYLKSLVTCDSTTNHTYSYVVLVPRKALGFM